MSEQLKIEELEHRADIEPRYLRDDQISALRQNFETHVPPEQRKAYEGVEQAVSEKFVEFFSPYISAEQKKYMQGSRVIMIDREEMDTFIKGIEEYTKDQDYSRAALGGMMYRGYKIVNTDLQNEREKILPYSSENEKGDMGVQTWHGRIPIVPMLTASEIIYPDKDFLMEEKKLEFVRDAEPFLVTNTWGSMALHEKIHGVQDYHIPLPILETAAHAYEREVFEKNKWYIRKVPHFDEAIATWKKLQEKIGDDLYKYIFGNLPIERKKEIDAELQSVFTPEHMKEIFPQLIWKTEPAPR